MMEQRPSKSGASSGRGSLETRLAELEERITHMESGPRLRERGRTLMDRVMPPEATQHFRNGGRESLIGVRTIVDHWIKRLDARDEAASAPERERIEVK